MNVTNDSRDASDDPAVDRADIVERLVNNFDPHDPDLSIDVLNDVFAGLRSKGVARSECHGGFWIASRYDDLVQVSRNTRVFSSAQGVRHPRHPEEKQAIPVEFDGELHAGYRRLFTKPLSKSRVDAAEDGLREIVGDLVSRYVEKTRAGDKADFAHDVAVQFPIRAVGLLLDWDEATEPEMTQLAGEMLENYGTDRGLQAGAELAARMQAVIDDRKNNPRGDDDPLTQLMNSQVDGRDLTEDEMRNTLRTFIFAGFETTYHAIASLVAHLADDGDLQSQMRQDPALIPKIVEEGLRVYPPAHTMFRTVTEPVSVGGADMSPGDKVVILHGSANRDESKYKCPAHFRLDRDDEPAQVAFGFGAHFCAGAYLARAEMKLLLEEFLRYPPFELAAPPEYTPHLLMGQMMGVEHLYLRFVDETK